MRITTEIIKQLNPCEDRFSNFISNYPDYDGTLEHFISLYKITYSDKVWVVTKLFSKEQNVKWAILCAKSVLHIFESEYPEDNAPRLALESAKVWLNEPNAANVAMYAVDAARYAVDAAAAARYAVDAACYAAKYAAGYANVAANVGAVSAAEIEQENLNLQFMLQCIQG